MLREAATSNAPAIVPQFDLPREARHRREKILGRIRD
jgi:hypothetical protein